MENDQRDTKERTCDTKAGICVLTLQTQEKREARDVGRKEDYTIRVLPDMGTFFQKGWKISRVVNIQNGDGN